MEEDDLQEFDELPKEEKIEVLRSLAEELDVHPGNLEDVGIQGEFTIRVLDEDGEEKRVETEKFKY